MLIIGMSPYVLWVKFLFLKWIYKHRHKCSYQVPFGLTIFRASTLELSMIFKWFASGNMTLFHQNTASLERRWSLKLYLFHQILSSDQALRYLTEGFMWYLLRKFVIWLYNVLVFLDEQARAWWKYIGGLPATVVSNTGKAIRVRF